MKKYRVINTKTNEIICGFLSEATDWEGLLSHMKRYAKEKLPLQWSLQIKDIGEWETIMSNN
jgi:hypothetical protein